MTKTPPSDPLSRAVENLCEMTSTRFDHSRYVKQAFILGLWHQSFPEYMLGHIEAAHLWQYDDFRSEGQGLYDDPYANLQKFQFASDTGDSWHQCYRDLRKLKWERLKVHREGGRLQYLLKNHRLSMPEGYRDLHLILDISISTCKQVQVGVEMKEVPVMKTVCEDLIELPEDHLIKDIKEGETVETVRIAQAEEPKAVYGNAEVVPLVVIDDVEELQRRRDIGKVSEVDLSAQGGPDVGEKFEDEIPF